MCENAPQDTHCAMCTVHISSVIITPARDTRTRDAHTSSVLWLSCSWPYDLNVVDLNSACNNKNVMYPDRSTNCNPFVTSDIL